MVSAATATASDESPPVDSVDTHGVGDILGQIVKRSATALVGTAMGLTSSVGSTVVHGPQLLWNAAEYGWSEGRDEGGILFSLASTAYSTAVCATWLAGGIVFEAVGGLFLGAGIDSDTPHNLSETATLVDGLAGRYEDYLSRSASE